MPEMSAYKIPLSAEDLAALGEIILIVGQIDNDMALSLTGLLGVDRPTANRLMWSQEPIDLWSGVLKGRYRHPHFDATVVLAGSEVKGVQRSRNDMIHADYRDAFPHNGTTVTFREAYPWKDELTGNVVASKSRDQTLRPSTDIGQLRNRAARASRLVAHVCFAVAPHGSWEASPWIQSIEPFLAKSQKRPQETYSKPTRLVTFDNVRPTVVDGED